jgi:fibronectin type 3 domain-containing protein
LSWATSLETNVVEYHVYRAESEEDEFTRLKVIGKRSHTTFLDGGRDPGNLADQHTYYYRLVAVNAVGAESDPSDVVRATTRDIPPVVRNLSASSGDPRQVTLTWEQSPDDSVVGYEVWRALENNENFVVVGGTEDRDVTEYIDRGGTRRSTGLGLLLDGTAYRYKVLAVNTADVRSKWSDPADARTKVAPVVPKRLRSTTDEPKRVTLSWQANPEADIASYQVEYSNRSGGPFRLLDTVDAPADTAVVSFVHEKLADGTELFYRLKAIDADDLESGWTEVVQGQAKPAPGQPRNLHSRTLARRVKVTWDPPAQSDIREYRIWSKTLLSWDMLDTTEDTEYELPPEKATRRLTLTVSCIDEDGLESRKSEPVRTERVVIPK